MKYLEYENVKRDFQRLTAVNDEEFEAQQYGTLLENAEIYVVSQLIISPSELTENQKAVCVYAAAAVAAYDRAFELVLSRKAVMTENGEVAVVRGGEELLQCAYGLRRAAAEKLIALGLVMDDTFSFMGV